VALEADAQAAALGGNAQFGGGAKSLAASLVGGCQRLSGAAAVVAQLIAPAAAAERSPRANPRVPMHSLHVQTVNSQVRMRVAMIAAQW